ncbi:MAG: NAD(P)/FAD-dependent oxidoreductase [Candidatus Competibacterales bacterium]
MSWDLVVIGAGPAGVAAALQGAALGLKTLLLDQRPTSGGQIYRGAERPDGVLGDDPHYARGPVLAERLKHSPVVHWPATRVWQLAGDGEIGLSRHGQARLIHGRQVIVASGAQERPFPIPGWTLPGVMTAGAAQILLKESDVAAPGAVFAGCGPLLYLVAHQYLQLGIPVAAVLDTTPTANYLRALPELFRALGAARYLARGLKYLAHIKRHTRHITGVTALRAEGQDRLEAVSYRRGNGGWVTLATEQLFLHQGVIPQVNLALAAGCEATWDEGQLGWRPVVDAWGTTSQGAIAVAGDAGAIGGAVAAELKGELAALGAAVRLGRLGEAEAEARARPKQKALAADLRIRPFLETLYRPSKGFRIPADDDTIVCRCEELTAKAINAAIATGAPGPNQLKSFCRCGMGPCQGRQCGVTVCEMIAAQRGCSVAEVGYFRLRPPVVPLGLEELAHLTTEDAAPEAAPEAAP